jgi:hypothetical protein
MATAQDGNERRWEWRRYHEYRLLRAHCTLLPDLCSDALAPETAARIAPRSSMPRSSRWFLLSVRSPPCAEKDAPFLFCSQLLHRHARTWLNRRPTDYARSANANVQFETVQFFPIRTRIWPFSLFHATIRAFQRTDKLWVAARLLCTRTFWPFVSWDLCALLVYSNEFYVHLHHILKR